MRLETRCDCRRLAGEPDAAAFAVGDIEAARDQVIDLLPGRHPQSCTDTLAREHAALDGSQCTGSVAAFVLEQMAQILVTGNAEPGAAAAIVGRALEVDHVRGAVRIEPILLFGEIVVGDPGTMQPA